MINEFICDICDILCIPVPCVSFDTSAFPTDTTMAQCSPDGTTIFLKKCSDPDPDMMFSIAHELRHSWQILNDRISSYKPADLCSSIEEYNLQPVEIDANAFAALIMIDFFNIKPLFEGMSDKVKHKIHRRMEQLAATL